MPDTPAEAPQNCSLCPRLIDFRRANKEAYPEYFNGAVPSFFPVGGDKAVELLIVGLAPGLHGANQTGRPFTGDFAGDLLYTTLLEFGFADGTYGGHANDGLALIGTMITNAVRCVPPENKPTGAEANTCRPFLTARLAALPALRVIISLGKISHDNVLRTLGVRLAAHPFGHGTEYPFQGPCGPVTLLSSYHCSRYNTNTGRLTEAMFHDVFARADTLLGRA